MFLIVEEFFLGDMGVLKIDIKEPLLFRFVLF